MLADAKSGNNVENVRVSNITKDVFETLITMAKKYVPYPKNTKDQWLSQHFRSPYVSTYISPEFYYQNLTLYTEQESEIPDDLFVVLTKFKNIEKRVITSFFIDKDFKNKTNPTKRIMFYDLCIHDRDTFLRLYYDDQFNRWDKKRYDEDVGNLLQDTFFAIQQFYKKQNQTMSNKEVIQKYISLL